MSAAPGKAIDTDEDAVQNAQGFVGFKGDSTVSEPFTFAEGYGLGLIARNPKGEWGVILEHLSAPARQIADAIIDYPQSASTDAKAAAEELMYRAGSSPSNKRP